MAGSVPSVGDKQRLVGPAAAGPGGDFRLRADANPYLTGDVTLASGTFITLNQVGQTITINCTVIPPSPATVAPPEVRESGAVGTSALYAREDHTHESPVIFWTQTGSPTDNVVSNRSTLITRTSSTTGGTNFCSYAVGSVIDGCQGEFATISGGRDCSAVADFDFVGGGDGNGSIGTSTEGYNCVVGGSGNACVSCSYCSIAGGAFNVISQIDDPAEEIFHAHASGSYNEVYRSGGTAGGIRARSYMAGEESYACGTEVDEPALAQDSRVVISGRTLSSGPNESVQLTQWTPAVTNGLIFQPDRSFTGELRVVASDTSVADQASWIFGMSFRTDGAGVLTVLNTSAIYTNQTAGAVLWNVTFTALANQLIVTFFTGAGVTASVNVCATLMFTQVANAPF